MFFVSEEFLHKYESGEDFTQTIDEAVPLGTELFRILGVKKRSMSAVEAKIANDTQFTL